MVSILEALVRENVVVDASGLNPGNNTRAEADLGFEDWLPWTDFNYTNLVAIYGNILRQEYAGSREPVALPLDLVLHDESSCDDVLRRFIIPTVNYALAQQLSPCHYGRGSRYPLSTGEIPDWSLFSNANTRDDGHFVSILPGDTKISSKWWPELIFSSHEEWKKPVVQVSNYMALLRSHYGFIVTDASLVVLRLTRAPTAEGLALNRSRRVGSHHQQYPSDASGMSAGSVFCDAEASGWDYLDPEYAVVHWDASGRGRLTIKLAFWCLAMMASCGGYLIDYSYPDLKHWVPSNGRFLNSAAGVVLSTVPRGHTSSQQPQPAVPSRPEGSSHAQGSSSRHTTHHRSAAEESGSSSTAGQDGFDSMEIYDSDDGTDTVVGSKTKRRVPVEIRKKTISRKLYFVDQGGRERDTSKEEWEKVLDGYELELGRHIYVTKRFPS
ncbi:hypothetical protein SPI_05323 [Niveomyces insectorum RCEF 264]|uniref:Uncharacterized protein n=1 Tax=Niveomyces insectorum RCEF 264 TaxID=1081102 RepID=A0A167U6Z0_9HYPO|nr:hypothetical protein SPI_05323 [Niveomyces insectorum RCEF 264]